MKTATKKWLMAASLMILGGSGGAYATGGKASWKEEVLLHDGRKVIVERSQTRGGRREIGQEVPVAEHIVSFKKPGTGQLVTWKSEHGMEPEKSSLLPLAFDVVAGTPYIVATPAGCIAYNKWGRPNPPYVIQKFDGNAWQRVPLADFPAEIKEANLVISALMGQFERRLTGRSAPVAASEIKEINSEARDPNVLYLRVFLREQLPSSQLCPPERTGFKAPYPIPSKDGAEGKK